MKEMKQAELFGKEKEPDKKSESAQRNNNALERGTVAYFEAQQRGNRTTKKAIPALKIKLR
jgi:hypothetical protein